MRRDRPEVVVVPRGDSSAKWFLWGALAGAVVALLYTPSTGEQTRRTLTRRLRQLRALTEEKVDDLLQSFGQGETESELGDAVEPDDQFEEEEEEDEFEDSADADLPAAAEYPVRVELEQRLQDARARRRRRREEAAD